MFQKEVDVSVPEGAAVVLILEAEDVDVRQIEEVLRGHEQSYVYTYAGDDIVVIMPYSVWEKVRWAFRERFEEAIDGEFLILSSAKIKISGP